MAAEGAAADVSDDDEDATIASLAANNVTTTTRTSSASTSTVRTSTSTSTTAAAATSASIIITQAHLFAAIERSASSPRPLVNFFLHPVPTGAAAHDDLTTKQRRSIICDLVKQQQQRGGGGGGNGTNNFNKVKARRLFSGLAQLLTKVVEEEAYYYLPRNENNVNGADNDENGNDQEDGSNEESSSNSNNAGKEKEEASSSAIQFLRCCSHLVEAYLDGLLSKRQQPRTRKIKRRGQKSEVELALAEMKIINDNNNNKNNNNKRQKIEVIDELFEVAQLLHDSLFPLQSCIESDDANKKEAASAQSAVFSMCELYWHGDFEDREQMVTQLIPLLLIKSLEDTAQKTDVKRLYSLRGALDLLDFEDASIEPLKRHLLRCAGNPLFLQSAEGRKFVGHLFRVDASLVAELHRAVRAQIPGAKRSILNAYGEIYFGAWKGAAADGGGGGNNNESREEEEENGAEENSSKIQTSIEENALQDFMYQAIHGKAASTVKSVRTVLDKFYLNKKTPEVESMLHRMYGPLLWRALSSANAQIRKQASAVLADTFPLRDPNLDARHTQEVVEKSVEALVTLMKDEVPSVRVKGCEASVRILSLFWNAVSGGDIRRLLNHIIAKHASDASSSAVRASAVDAVTALLKEEKTHAVLRPLLPSLGNLIHDKTEKVRFAVVKLLLLVKTIKGMKYYHVVPADHLLARLADEGQGRNNPTGQVAMGLSDLLGNSFFPTGKNKTMTDVINRTLRLLTDDPHAAVTFYRNASTQYPVEAIARLIAALMKCLCYFVMEEKRRCGEDVGELSMVVPEDGEIVCKGGGGGLYNTGLMATIAESISILWESIETELEDEQNEHAVEVLTDVFSGNVITNVYCHFENKLEEENNNNPENAKLAECFRACRAILNCAGKVDESKIDGLRAHIVSELSKVSAMPAERQIRSNLSPNVALLCAWGMTNEVADCLASCISQYLSDDAANDVLDASSARKSDASRKRKQRGNTQGKAEGRLPMLDIDVCLGILGNILKGSYPGAVSARESILNSDTAFNTIASALKTAKSVAERVLRPRIPEDTKTAPAMSKHIGISIEYYGRLLIHKESMKGEIPMKLSPELKSLMNWATNTIMPSLIKLVGQDSNPLRDLDLSSINMSIGSPIASPFPGDHTKSKMNRNSSPIVGNLGDTSFMSERGSNIFEDKANFASTRSVAIAAMASILHIFAEWSSLRFVGDTYISNQIAQLCKLLECSDKAVRKGILQPIFHVAITSLKNDGDSMLFKEVLLCLKNVDPSLSEEEIIYHSIGLVISLRDDSILKAAISTIVTVTCTIVEEAEEDASEVELPFLDKIGVSMKKVIDRVLSDKKSCLILAQRLVDEPESSLVRECLELELRSSKTDGLDEIIGKRAAENENVAKDTAARVDIDKENIDANQMQGEHVAD